MAGMAHAGPGEPPAPLSAARLRAALAAAAGAGGSLWSDIRVIAETGSTNEDVLKLAGDGAPEGLVLAAESQTAGRGRQGRGWQSMPGAALTFSVLLRPRQVPQSARGWIPLLAGVAAASAVRGVTGVRAVLKWPNDVLAGLVPAGRGPAGAGPAGGKLAGILAEQSGDAVVVGIGVNVLGASGDLPVATAASLEQYGAGGTDRTALLAAVLAGLEHWYARWRATGTGDAEACGLRREYLALCDTIGRQVRVQLPGGQVLAGQAAGVDEAGQLLVSPAAGNQVAVSAGDVIHVR